MCFLVLDFKVNVHKGDYMFNSKQSLKHNNIYINRVSAWFQPCVPSVGMKYSLKQSGKLLIVLNYNPQGKKWTKKQYVLH